MGTEVVLVIAFLLQAYAGEEWVLPEKLRETIATVKNQPLGHRISSISYDMRGKGYVVDPIGEDGSPDTDLVARYDVYDCLTFVEEVLSLTLAADPSSAFLIRNALRYKAPPYTYENRNHFMISQWMPNAIEKGLLTDITASFGRLKKIRKKWRPRIWTHWIGRRKFHLENNQFPLGIYSIDVLPLDKALKNIYKFPEGSILLVVRSNHPHNPILVTHLGFVVYRHGKPRFRHASKMGRGSVRDDSLWWYLNHLKTFKWPVAGVAVFFPVEQGPRRIQEPSMVEQ